MKLFMDESGNGNPSQPLIVGAVELGDDADETEEKILDLYERLFARNSLAGFLSFEEFRKKGFHASNDPLEVSGPFLELIRDTFFRAYIVVTDRTGVPGDTESKRIEFMYVKLLSDILIRHRREPEILCYIEQSEDMASIIRRLPDSVVRQACKKIGKAAPLPKLNIAMVAKRDYMSTAVVDYVMAAVSRWILADRTTNPGHRPYRAFREIEPFISMLYSFEHGSISSRRDPLH
ncbi:hypothetical protein QBA57_20570 [Streptomyces scabiei]|uniref:hypothetical protein n=1 Tax=Streptomyces scabiei TaxID=1930 RepID=UPI001B3159E5|nr:MULTISPECIES: hypothetical protein [Streptomyces]MBP5884673.1 hypothetical protein [Streptomyces sp. LBUM 1487]MBP5900632.1 hypothetical protein [Streptomyces sp. LBUM 1488]MDW8474143.1 hypothetical protein [Streptomyces scabiei]MDX2569808.1 hypothetical protein [Streptomyces scabiei]MDX2628485.1 hypothetical protein [Streptomyces scabiei]